MKHDRIPVIHGAHCCGFVAGPKIPPDSHAYHVQHREWHVAKFPKTDASTLAVLDGLIAKYAKKASVAS